MTCAYFNGIVFRGEIGNVTGDAARYRIDDLRRLAADLGSRLGLPPARGAALAKHLLWFDAIGARSAGFARLPSWLDRLELGEFEPDSEGKIGQEHASTAQLSAGRGLPPIVLDRAAEVAGQKARDTGLGLVRVSGLLPGGPAAPIAAALAIGPLVGLVLGPGPEQAIALPTAEGLPLVYDSILEVDQGERPEAEANDDREPIATDLAGLVAPWALLAEPGEVIVVALAVSALEPLSSFQERVSAACEVRGDRRVGPHSSGWLAPREWEARRRAVREHGLGLPSAVEEALRKRAEAAGLSFPSALPSTPG
ncbi:hypothetical protein BH23PLA1_BH23PLA1_40300 [soil metagenome]